MAVKHTIRVSGGKQGDRWLEKTQNVSLTPMKAIRKNCLECVGWVTQEVDLCQSPLCALFPYRFGKEPNSTRKGNAGSLASARDRGSDSV